MKKENQILQPSGGTLETWYLECDINDSVASIKEAIEKLTSISTSNQKIIFNGKQLEDSHTLSEYEVESETIKLVQLGKETQTLSDLNVAPHTVIYLHTNTENKKPQLLVENTHFGAKGEKMKAELYVEREPSFSLITNQPSKVKRNRRGDQFIEGDTSRFGIRIVRLDNGKCIELIVNRTFTLKKVLELIKQDESKALVALLS